MHRIIYIILILLFALRAEGAMVRVAGIENGRTIVIERGGTRVSVKLAGVAITDELRARELLRWSIGSAWVMLEPSGDEFLVYRSPDAMFINRELVTRGFARATQPGIAPEQRLDVTYLGQLHPEGRQGRAATGSGPGRRTYSGTSRSRDTPKPRSKARSAPSSGGSSGRTDSGRSSGARTRDPRPRGSSR